MLNNIKIYSLLGLATRSRNVVSGEFATENAVKSYKAELVLIGMDASNNTVKKFQNMCEFYKVPIYILGTKEELGHAMGKESRASLAVTDNGFAKAIMQYLE
ncbi:MAG: ribosomal L7Ae/L30e/S12e/Gadd45 family protein [Lachnospiraceae bacterium]